MAALTADRNTQQKELGRRISVKLAVVQVFKGGMIAVTNATGFGAAAADAVGTTVIGVAMEGADNTGGSAGDIEIAVEKGVAAFKNDGTVTQASVGQTVTVLDDQTVSIAATTTNDIVAGTLDYLEGTAAGDLCWVKFHEHQ